MSYRPRNTNRTQNFLYNQGERAIGVDEANISPDATVRKQGLKRTVLQLGAGMVLSGLAAGAVVGVDAALDRQDRLTRDTTTEEDQTRLLLEARADAIQAFKDSHPQATEAEVVEFAEQLEVMDEAGDMTDGGSASE